MDLDASKNGGLNQRKCWDKTFYAGIPGYATNNIVFGLAQKWGILRGVRYTPKKNIQFFKIIFHQEYYSGISELLHTVFGHKMPYSSTTEKARIIPWNVRTHGFNLRKELFKCTRCAHPALRVLKPILLWDITCYRTPAIGAVAGLQVTRTPLLGVSELNPNGNDRRPFKRNVGDEPKTKSGKFSESARGSMFFETDQLKFCFFCLSHKRLTIRTDTTLIRSL